MKSKRIVMLDVLPGEPTDGTGRVSTHLVVADDAGPFTEPHFLHPLIKDGQIVKGQLIARPTKARLACDRNRIAVPVIVKGNIIKVTPRSTDPRAVTCPKCMASMDYITVKAEIDRAEENR